MTATLENSAERSRRPRWQSFVQFSLRSLLLITTLTAVACWWFLRPPVLDEELAGKHLQLRRQVRLVPVPANKLAVEYINVGRWQLRDDQSELLVAGRYHQGVPEGWWTTYHANGRKAVEGKVIRGAKTGLWRVWHESGHPASEVQYRALHNQGAYESILHGPARTWHPNGQIQLEGAYKDDCRTGTWTFYDEQGRITEKREYNDTRSS